MKTSIKTARAALVVINLFILGVILFTSCQQQKKGPKLTRQQLVSQTELTGVRLADGMPLGNPRSRPNPFA